MAKNKNDQKIIIGRIISEVDENRYMPTPLGDLRVKAIVIQENKSKKKYLIDIFGDPLFKFESLDRTRNISLLCKWKAQGVLKVEDVLQTMDYSKYK
jgi:hypothetical protein